MTEEKGRFGLSAAEFQDLKNGLRYGAIIVITVLITFSTVAGIAGLVGYVPPSPNSALTDGEATPELTPESTVEAETDQ